MSLASCVADFKYLGSLNMSQKFVPEASIFVSAINKARNICNCQREMVCKFNVPYHRLHRGEGVWSDLGPAKVTKVLGLRNPLTTKKVFRLVRGK